VTAPMNRHAVERHRYALAAYVSKHGSTGVVARRIAARLEERGGRVKPALRWGGALAALAAAWLVFGAAPSLAAWSTPRTVKSAFLGALATDARGDVAPAWVNYRDIVRPCSLNRRGCLIRTDVSLQVGFGGPTGPLVTRTVWRCRNAAAVGVTAALDARGELTVAWVDAPSGGVEGRRTVLAVYRTAAGRWSAVQVVGHSSPMNPVIPSDYVDPKLAVAPDREVLLTWNAGYVFGRPGDVLGAAGLAQAWRAPGHRFGPVAVYPLKGAGMIGQTPVFDSGGAAHVYGIVCDNSRHVPPPPKPPARDSGVMLSTAAHSHRFGAPLVVAPAPAENLVVSFSAPGEALASWLRYDGCGENRNAPPYARVMLRGSLQAPVALAPNDSAVGFVPAVAANGGGGSVGWLDTNRTYPAQSLRMATAGAAGRFSVASTQANNLVPVARDGAGNVLLDELNPTGEPLGGPTPVSPFAVQPAAGGALQPSPVPQSPFGQTGQHTVFATAEPVGRGAALAWPLSVSHGSGPLVNTGKVAIATWRP
jgi:hypothetical protein